MLMLEKEKKMEADAKARKQHMAEQRANARKRLTEEQMAIAASKAAEIRARKEAFREEVEEQLEQEAVEEQMKKVSPRRGPPPNPLNPVSLGMRVVGLADGVAGVRVTELTRYGAAWISGIEDGDIIRRVDGRVVESLTHFKQIVSTFRVGQAVSMMIYREGTTLSLFLHCKQARDAERYGWASYQPNNDNDMDNYDNENGSETGGSQTNYQQHSIEAQQMQQQMEQELADMDNANGGEEGQQY